MTKVYVGKSKINGKGIFAKKDIKKGEIIFIAKGKIIKYLPKEDLSDLHIGLNWIGVDENIWVDPCGTLFDFINHSCVPNAGIKGKITFIALKNIKKDKEITFDYSISESDVFWKMKCCCGQRDCRKIIRSVQFLPIKIFKKYLPYIPTYFKKVYMEYHKI